ncbi:helix-turn-helix domain-containing protein [Rhodococcus qingshengii]|nr:helix-turn-helix domain-containing protein [Rhodococcus qingshengii]
MGEPRLLNAVEAGKLLGINESTVRKLWCSGDLKCVHIGRGRKVSTTEIQRYINDHEVFEVSPS